MSFACWVCDNDLFYKTKCPIVYGRCETCGAEGMVAEQEEEPNPS